MLAWAPEFLYATGIADIRIVNDQMRRLIFFVLRPRVVQIGQLVEGQLAITFRWTDQLRVGSPICGQTGQRLHALVARHRSVAIAQAASAGNHLQPGVEYPGEHAVLKSLMQVADFPELFLDPAGFDFLLIVAEHRCGEIIFLQSLKRSLGREHPALDRQVNSLQPRRIQEPRRVAQQHPPIARHRRNCPPSAIRHRLGPVADHLAALKQLRDPRMPLELLQHALRIEPRIHIVEPSHKAERDHIIF